MAATQTLEFENARALQALYANDLKLLKTLEDSLQVKVTTRDGWLRLEGEQTQIDRAKRVFDQLEKARKKGVDVRRDEFNYALRAVMDANGDGTLDELIDTKIIASPRRPPIIAKTDGQRAYIRAIQGNDMVFGIGPAGTGKTYLAMAMAISALKRDEVTRIILTRPAVEAGEALGFLPGDLNEKIFPYLRPLYDALHDMLNPTKCKNTSSAARSKSRRSPTCAAALCIARSSCSMKRRTRPPSRVYVSHPARRGFEMRGDGRPHANRFARQ